MKKILILGLMMMLLVSCSSLHRGSSRMNESPYADGVKNEGIEVREEQMPEAEKTEEPEVVVREEKVRSVDATETTENIYRYYVIIGSFRYLDNARNYKNTLLNEGFVPVILENENGLFRVSVAAYNDEEPARRNIASIRRNYPKYGDVWLLIRKQ